MSMHSTFPSISRRQALLGMSGTLAGTLAWPSVLLAAEKIPTFTFVILSDTHLGRKDTQTPQRQWQRTAKEINAVKAEFALHLGDVVDGGREKQYPIYKEIRSTIDKPVYEIPGNHDPVEAFAKHLRKTIDIAIDHKGVRFVLLNNSRRTSHDGFLSDEQLTWLEKQCVSAKKKDLFVVLAMHVPVHSNRHPDRGWHVKPQHGQTKLYQILKAHEDRVLALFHGHFHNGIRGWNDHGDLHEIIFPSALYNQDRGLKDKKAPGYNLPQFRPGFTVITFDAKGMHLSYKPVGMEKTTDKLCEVKQW